MITPEQQKWLDHLCDNDQISIFPWDPTTEEKYEIVSQQIQSFLGHNFRVEHRGASSLKISGQDEIDIYVPIKQEYFANIVEKATQLYGNPRSHYPMKRARFVTLVQGKHTDIFIINEDDQGWRDIETFHTFLLAHPDKLESYEKLKESLAGKSTKAYYTAKTEFINEILATAYKLR